MSNLSRSPFLISAISFLVMWCSARIGAYFRKRQRNLGDDARQDLDLIVASTLTLLGLIIGFSFSMAINRYDLRKNYEEAEANAIGTEYVRADFLPPADGAKVRELLREYLVQRVAFYQARDDQPLQKINAVTAQLQNELWLVVQSAAKAQPTPISALLVSGMNDVLNSQGYTQAGVVEPNPTWSMGIDGSRGHLLEPLGWIWRPQDRNGSHTLHTAANCSFHRIFSNCRHRKPAQGRHSRESAKLISLAQSLDQH